jgi:hypothetical protein
MTMFATGTLVALLALGGCEAPDGSGDVESATSALAATSATGFVWAHSATGSYDANQFYSYNSTSATNHVTWLSTGSYRVDFPGLGAEPTGNVQVTAYGTLNPRCKVERWGRSGVSMLQVFVRCFTSSGAPVDSLFDVAFQRRPTTPGVAGGYVTADQPTASSYTPDPANQWNSVGGTITINHGSSPGVYFVKFPGQSFSGGTVQVTAVGSGSEHCKVGDWGQTGLSDQVVTVYCFTTGGSLVDTTFSALLAVQWPNYPVNGYGYVWADEPSSSSYVVTGTRTRVYTGNPSPGPVTVTRTGLGRYSVVFKGLGSTSKEPTHVQVTGYGGAAHTCKTTGWSSDTIQVACFSVAGTPVDAMFTATYTHPFVPTPLP